MNVHIASSKTTFIHIKKHHFHQHPEVFIQCKGISTFSFGAHKLSLKPKELLIIPPGVAHKEIGTLIDEQFDNVVIFVHDNGIDVHHGICKSSGERPKDIRYSRLGGTYSSVMQQLLKNVIQLKTQNNHFKVTQSLLSSFLQCLRSSPILLEEKNQVVIDHPLVNSCLSLIKKCYNSPECSIQSLAKQLGCSPNYLSSLFLQVTGSKLQKYIFNLRMNQAKTMLCESDYNVNQTGHACGYENISYFVQQFKKFYGMTPKKMKESEI